MGLKNVDRLELPPTADMHVHLRQDKLMELVTPQISLGGTDVVVVMVSILGREFAYYSWANVANMMASCFHLAQLAATNYNCCGRA
jgi:hypothetical protein